MLVSEPTMVQVILFACNTLEAKRQPISLETVNRFVVNDTGCELPPEFIERTLADRDSYVWNVCTGGFEKVS